MVGVGTRPESVSDEPTVVADAESSDFESKMGGVMDVLFFVLLLLFCCCVVFIVEAGVD